MDGIEHYLSWVVYFEGGWMTGVNLLVIKHVNLVWISNSFLQKLQLYLTNYKTLDSPSGLNEKLKNSFNN